MLKIFFWIFIFFKNINLIFFFYFESYYFIFKFILTLTDFCVFSWDSKAKISCSFLLILYFSAIFSAVNSHMIIIECINKSIMNHGINQISSSDNFFFSRYRIWHEVPFDILSCPPPITILFSFNFTLTDMPKLLPLNQIHTIDLQYVQVLKLVYQH